MAASKSEEGGFAVPVALFYGALFVFYGTQIPFMPVWLDWRGLSAGEISTVLAAPLFLRLLVTPAVAMIADRGAAHRACLITLSWLGLAFVLALAASQSFWPILVFAVLMAVSNSTVMPLIDTIAVHGTRLRGLDYGRMRLWGSLSFIAASVLGGIAVTQFGGGAGVWLVAIGCALTAIAAPFVPAPMRLVEPAPPAAAPFWKAAEPRQLLAQREFQLFLIAAGLVQAAHAAFFSFGTLLWQKQGLSASWGGTLWAIGVIAEVSLFSISGRVADRFGAARLIALGAAASILRWVAMAFSPPLAVLIPLQLLHGVTYGATHIGAMHFLHDAIPRDKSGSGQALYATVSAGVAMGFATLIAGWVYARAGALSYLAMAAVAAVALMAALRLNQVWNGRLLGAEPLARPTSTP